MFAIFKVRDAAGGWRPVPMGSGCGEGHLEENSPEGRESSEQNRVISSHKEITSLEKDVLI